MGVGEVERQRGFNISHQPFLCCSKDVGTVTTMYTNHKASGTAAANGNGRRVPAGPMGVPAGLGTLREQGTRLGCLRGSARTHTDSSRPSCHRNRCNPVFGAQDSVLRAFNGTDG